MAKLPNIVIDIQGLTGAANEAIKSGLTAQRDYRRAVTEDWIKFAQEYAKLQNNSAPEAFAMISAQYADDIPVGGDYNAEADQLTDVRTLDENTMLITARSTTPVVVAGFDLSAIQRGEVRLANRLQYRVKVTTGRAFIDAVRQTLGAPDLAQQLNVLGTVLERIQNA